MVRVKFLIFALLALGLGLAHLSLLSGPMRARAIEDAQAQAAAGTAEVVRTLEARRGIARAVALKLAASAELATAAQELSALEPLTAEAFAPVRAAAESALPKDLTGVVIGVVTPAGAVHARAGGEPSLDAAALDVKALAQAEAPSVVDAFGAPHAVAAVPLVWRFVRVPGAEKLETQLAATLVVAVPLLPEGALEDAAKASGTAALGLVKDERAGGQRRGAEEPPREGHGLAQGRPAGCGRRDRPAPGHGPRASFRSSPAARTSRAARPPSWWAPAARWRALPTR